MKSKPGEKTRPKGLVSAEKLCAGLLAKLEYAPEMCAVFEIWDRLLGHQAKRARAVGLKGHRLCVEVDSNVHMHDIFQRKRMLLKKLNQHFGARTVISDIILELTARRKTSGERPQGR